MDDSRQTAFRQLRPPCVELSSTVLKFKANQVPLKTLLQHLQTYHAILDRLGQQDVLDAKLAEYAFFPLTHVFNESPALSSRCLELAAESVTVLVSKGWRHQLSPELGKQLLLLMSLLAGSDPKRQKQTSPGEVQVACFDAIATVVTHLASSRKGQSVLDDQNAKSIVDQLVYLLLERMSESESDAVQLSASHSLLTLFNGITNQLLLTSLLPRTVSSLVNVLRPSTQVRRPQKVLVSYLELLQTVLERCLSDDIVNKHVQTSQDKPEDRSSKALLDEGWLKATTSQVRIALTSVFKLRTYDGDQVRRSLAELCIMLLQKCSHSLTDSFVIIVETVLCLIHHPCCASALQKVEHMIVFRDDLASTLKNKVYEWSQTIPRVMMANNAKQKLERLAQLSCAIGLLSQIMQIDETISSTLTLKLIDGVAGSMDATQKPQSFLVKDSIKDLTILNNAVIPSSEASFEPVVLTHASQEQLADQIVSFVQDLSSRTPSNTILKTLVESVNYLEASQQLAAIWLSLKYLEPSIGSELGRTDFLDTLISFSDDGSTNIQLMSQLYSTTLPFLTEYEETSDVSTDWRQPALTLECVALQAHQMGDSYRLELIDTLYPMLSCLGSSIPSLQRHAITTLSSVAKSCQYSAVSDMLIENADYLVNSIAMKLNSFDISPQAPIVLLMLIRLCGSKLLPYLDDLISSIFGALDNFHGYPRLVEVLFEVLKSMVEESTKSPQLIIEAPTPSVVHRVQQQVSSSIADIIEDLDRWQRKEKEYAEADEELLKAPHRPWKETSTQPLTELEDDADEVSENDREAGLPVAKQKEAEMSKSYKILLNIAQATTPHLASPSPKVRNTLLQLLEEITPLLSRDENSYLPLVNAVWPTIISILFRESTSAEQPHIEARENEMTYNVCAAAYTVAEMCKGAGDFMSTRVADIFPRLDNLFRTVFLRVVKKVEQRKPTANDKILYSLSLASATTENAPTTSQDISDVTGSTSIPISRLPQSSVTYLNVTSTSRVARQTRNLDIPMRTADTQILQALAQLFVSIIANVRVSEDDGDKILRVLLAFVDLVERHRGVNSGVKSLVLAILHNDDSGRSRGKMDGSDSRSNHFALETVRALRSWNEDALLVELERWGS